MRAMSRILAPGLLLLSLAACSLPGSTGISQPTATQLGAPATEPPTPTDSPTTAPSQTSEELPTLEPTAPPMVAPTDAPVVNGSLVQSNGIALTLPTGIASGVLVTTVPAQAESVDLPPWDIYPEHRVVEFQGYQLQDHFHQPRLEIFPIEAYREMSEGAASIMSRLEALLASGDLSSAENLPLMPIFNAGQMFHAQAAPLEFQNGRGIRFLTQYGQAAGPINNQNIFYSFQGITADGQFYVAALLPISHGMLAQTANFDEEVPEGGFLLPAWEAADFAEQYQSYIADVTAALNSAGPGDFHPDLADLDGLIQSLLVQ